MKYCSEYRCSVCRKRFQTKSKYYAHFDNKKSICKKEPLFMLPLDFELDGQICSLSIFTCIQEILQKRSFKIHQFASQQFLTINTIEQKLSESDHVTLFTMQKPAQSKSFYFSKLIQKQPILWQKARHMIFDQNQTDKAFIIQGSLHFNSKLAHNFNKTLQSFWIAPNNQSNLLIHSKDTKFKNLKFLIRSQGSYQTIFQNEINGLKIILNVGKGKLMYFIIERGKEKNDPLEQYEDLTHYFQKEGSNPIIFDECQIKNKKIKGEKIQINGGDLLIITPDEIACSYAYQSTITLEWDYVPINVKGLERSLEKFLYREVKRKPSIFKYHASLKSALKGKTHYMNSQVFELIKRILMERDRQCQQMEKSFQKIEKNPFEYFLLKQNQRSEHFWAKYLRKTEKQRKKFKNKPSFPGCLCLKRSRKNEIL